MNTQRTRRLLIDSSVFLLCLVVAWVVVPTFMRRPWDLETYVYAARACQAGLNPYDPTSLERVAGRPVGMLFLYPAVTLPFFLPLTQFTIQTATIVWLGVKLTALLLLFQIWRTLLSAVPLLILAPAAAFAFNGAILWDLRAGNVTAVQDLVLWLGLVSFVHGRRAVAAAEIAASALFKIIPVVFLCLFTVPSSRNAGQGWRVAAVALAIIVVLIYVPGVAMGWVPHLAPDVEFGGPWGLSNPSMLSLVNSVSIHYQDVPISLSMNVLLWLGFLLVLALVSLWPLRRAWTLGDPRLWVFTLTVLIVLLQPRPMAYGYFLAVPAILALGRDAFGKWGVRAGALLLIVQALMGVVIEYRDPVTTNLPFLELLGCWLLYVGWCWRDMARR